MNKQIRLIIQITLAIACAVLAFLIYESIMEPVRFNKDRFKREEIVIQRLKNIRTVQLAHKSSFGRYITSIDSIALFLKNGKLPTIIKIGTVPDSLTEAEALKLKIISRDTVLEDAFAVLFPEADKESFLSKFRYIPFTDQKELISVSAGFLDKGGYKVPVFEAKMPYTSYMHDLDNQLVRNLTSLSEDLNRYPGIKVGSMDEAITEGNWE